MSDNPTATPGSHVASSRDSPGPGGAGLMPSTSMEKPEGSHAAGASGSTNGSTNGPNSLLMTPRTNLIPSVSTPMTDAATEIRKPVHIKEESVSTPGPSTSTVDVSVGSPYPLTFANSISSVGAASDSIGSNGPSSQPNNGGGTDLAANAGINSSINAATSTTTTAATEAGDPNTGPEAAQQQSDESKVSAYARLDFESFTFYVQTLQVLLGRRAEHGSSMVDVHLGPAKAISRKHAKIFYNFGTQRFELSVLGRNGAFVSDVFVEAGSTIPLKDGTKIQIGQIPFTFVLPTVTSSSSSNGNNNNSVEQDVNSSEDHILNPTDAVTFKEHQQTSSRSASPVHKKASGVSKVKAEKNHPQLPSMGIEVPANFNPSSDGSGLGLGLGLGLGYDSNDYTHESTPIEPSLLREGSEPRSAKSNAPKEKERKKKVRKEYKPEEIPPEYREKPPYSYSHLICTALRAHAPPTGISLSDIYKAIQDVFPYYKYCPPGWQNSVRHNLSSSKAFRKVSKEGKGWLWGIDEEYMEEKERQKQRVAAAKAKMAQPSVQNTVQSSLQGSLQGSVQQSMLNSNNHHHHPSSPSSLPASLSANAHASSSSPPGSGQHGHSQHPPNSGISIKEQLEQNGSAARKEKTIAELAREIDVQRRGTGHYHDYSNITRESLAALKKDETSSASKPHTITPHPAVLSANAAFKSGSAPSTTSIQAQLAANRSSAHGSSHEGTRTSTPDSQVYSSTNANGAAVSKSTTSNSASANNLNLSKDTLKALGVLQQKIQSQLGANSGISASMLTNALAIAIAQVAKTGGPAAVTAMLNGKNPTQLAQVLQSAFATIKKKQATASSGAKPSSGPSNGAATTTATSSGTPLAPAPGRTGASVSPTPPASSTVPVQAQGLSTTAQDPVQSSVQSSAESSVPTVSKESSTVPLPQLGVSASTTSTISATSTNTSTNANTSSGLETSRGPPVNQSASASPAPTPGSNSVLNPLSTLNSGGKPPSAATIAEVLAQASKISNPSPSMQAALQQLQAHAKRLEASKAGEKRPNEDVIEAIDNTAVKSAKQ